MPDDAPQPDPTVPPAEVPVDAARAGGPIGSGPAPSAAPSGLQPVDFRAPTPLSRPAQRQLRLCHEECARALATRLSIYLRLDCRVALAGLEPVRCRRWLDRLSTASHVTLFGFEGKPGLGVVEFSPQLGFIFVDRLLGGTGEPEPVERGLSELEKAVVDEVVLLLLREWCQQLPMPEPVRPVVRGHETSARFLPVAADEAPLLGLSWELTLGERVQCIQIGLPLTMLEPVLSQMAAEPAPADAAAEAPALRPAWNPQFDHVRLPLTARCEDFEVSARRLAHLEVGDVLPIHAAFLNCVQVRLAAIPKFVGRLGRQGQQRAVELTASLQK